MSAFCLYAACIKPAADKNARSNCPQKPSSGGYACNKIKSEYNINVFSAGLICLNKVHITACCFIFRCLQAAAGRNRIFKESPSRDAVRHDCFTDEKKHSQSICAFCVIPSCLRAYGMQGCGN